MSDVLAAADANMRETWRTVTQAGPSPSAVERDSALLLASGLPVGLFNPAFVSAAVDDGDALVAEIVEHYRALGLPFILYFRDEHDRDHRLYDAATSAGLIEHYRPPLMVMDPIVDAPALPNGVEIVPVDESNLDDSLRVLAEAFGMPIELGRAAFPPSLLAVDSLIPLLALVDGEPASTAAASITGDVGGVYNVATLPGFRGRGVGAAATWAAVAAGAAAGATRSVLQASEAGRPVYERMGFATPDRYRQLEPRT